MKKAIWISCFVFQLLLTAYVSSNEQSLESKVVVKAKESDLSEPNPFVQRNSHTDFSKRRIEFEKFVDGPRGVPGNQEIAALNTEDVDVVNTLYKQSPLSSRRKLTWALAVVGNDLSVGLLTNALVAEFDGKNLSQVETDVLYDTVQVLGFLASQSEAAFNFVKSGTDYEFWKQNRKWAGASDYYGGTERILVSNSILGVGYSGRTEALILLQNLARRDALYVYNMAGSIATAAFYQERAAASGPADLLTMHLSLDESGEKYQEWIERTENGKKWREWSTYVKGHKPDNIK